MDVLARLKSDAAEYERRGMTAEAAESIERARTFEGAWASATAKLEAAGATPLAKVTLTRSECLSLLPARSTHRINAENKLREAAEQITDQTKFEILFTPQEIEALLREV